MKSSANFGWFFINFPLVNFLIIAVLNWHDDARLFLDFKYIMSSIATSSCSSSKKIKLQENIEEYEPLTPLGIEHFEKKSLFGLLKSIIQNYNLKWFLMPFAQKCYLLSKQCFVRKFCRGGGCSCDAFEFIEKAKKRKDRYCSFRTSCRCKYFKWFW